MMANKIEPMKFKFKRKTVSSTSSVDTSHQQTINSFFKVSNFKCEGTVMNLYFVER